MGMTTTSSPLFGVITLAPQNLPRSIFKLKFENNEVYVRSSECRSIFCCNVGRKRGIAHMGPDREPVTEATFKLAGNEVYFRLTLIGMDGKRAYTNAYFLDDLNS
jgi:hypothetical protein